MKRITIACAVALFTGPAVAPAQIATEPTPLPEVAAEASEVEAAYWRSVQASDDPRLYLDYLERFPDGAFRDVARTRLDVLWERALGAFALLEQMGISPDTPASAAPGVAAPPPAAVPLPTVVPEAPKPPRNPPSWTRIRNTQNQLRAHGCYKGVVDGVWGEESIKAMRRFNRQTGSDWPDRQPTVKALKSMRTLTKSGVRVCR